MDPKEDVFLDLEKRLLEDNNGELRRELESYLGEWRMKVKRQMDAGLPPEEFSRFQRAEEAISRAMEVIGRVWTLLHP